MRRARSLAPTILLALACGMAAPAARAELIWTSGTAEELLEAARARDLPLFLVFHAEWCGFCRRLDRETLDSPLVGKSEGDFIAGRIDVDLPDGGAAAKRWNVTGLPALMVLAPDGRVVSNVVGFKTAQEVALLLRDAMSQSAPLGQRAAAASRPGATEGDLVAAARDLLDAGRIEDARPLLERALAVLPARSAETARARILLATTDSRRSGTEAALAELARAAAATDDADVITEAFTLRISILRSLDGPGPKAELVRTWQEYADRLESDPTVQEDCVRGLQELDVAPALLLSRAGRALALSPDSASANGARAQALYSLGRDDEALAAINRAVQLAPKESSWRILRLRILDRLQAASKRRS